MNAAHNATVELVGAAGGELTVPLGRFVIKRGIDLFLACALIVILAPLLLVVALAVRLDSRGPALFRQTRAGARPVLRGSRVFWEPRAFGVYKFRSMFVGADEAAHRAHIEAFVSGEIAGDNGFKLEDDPRVTRVGRLLRRSSLDELPQLFNVVRGEMSLVGPRPVPLYEDAAYTEEERERRAALPGVTGLWQISGRCELSFSEMVRLDVEYVRTQSTWLDLKIMALTIPAVLSGRGAG